MSGSHSSSDDSNDSRKRPSEQILYSDSIPKRPNCEDNVHLKVLIPSIAVGSVIGKSGDAILNIQKKANTKVKISKQDQFYPGTTERVCLIIGSTEGVQSVHNYIMGRIMEHPDPNPHATEEGRINVERHKQVKLLVPNSTAGMIIGKCGSYIEGIKWKTGAYVQISQKPSDHNLIERCIVIAGNPDQTRAAVNSILAVIAADPQSSGCPNLSYADIQGPVASIFPTGSPYAIPVTQSGSNTSTGWLVNPQSDTTATAALLAAMSAHQLQRPLSRYASNTFNLLNHYSFPFDVPTLLALASANQSSHNVDPTQLNQSVSPTTTFTGLNANSASLGGADLLTACATPYVAGQSPLSPTLFDQNVAAMQQTALFNALRSPSSSSLATPKLSSQLLYHQQQCSDSPLLGSPDTSTLSSNWSQSIVAPGAFTGASSGYSTPSITHSATLAAALSAATAIAAGGSANPISHLHFGSSALCGSMTPTPISSLALSQLVPAAGSIDHVHLPTGSTTVPPHSLLLALNEAVIPQSVTTLGTQAPTSVSVDSSPFSPYHSFRTVSQISPVTFKRTISIPENFIHIIFGSQGRSITGLQAGSDTVIQVSQKGVYLPGTSNRVVTITGAQPNVQYISSVIEERVAFEQFRRVSGSFYPAHTISSLTSQSQSSFLQSPVTQAPRHTYPSTVIPGTVSSPSCTRFPTVTTSICTNTGCTPVASSMQSNIKRIPSTKSGQAPITSVNSSNPLSAETGNLTRTNVSTPNAPVFFNSSPESVATITVPITSAHSRPM